MNMTTDKFKPKRDNSFTKSCIECLSTMKAYADKNKNKNKCKHGKRKSHCKECGGSSFCEHGKRKCQCKECGGSSFCEHGKKKSQCKECGGSSFCEHGKQKYQCKECGGSSFCEHGKKKSQCKLCIKDQVSYSIKSWLRNTRQTDKKCERYDPTNHIDTDFCRGLVEDYKNCYWCKVEMHHGVRDTYMATIERLDNSIGHTKLNCVLCCWGCNCKRISNI
jgi:hypothetical protein